MIRIIEQQTIFIREYRLRLKKRNAMLSLIQVIFLLIPFKS